VATDDLFAPLGLDKKPARARLPSFLLPVTAGVLGVALASFVIWVILGHDPRAAGEPMAVAKVNLGAAAGTAELRSSETDPTPPEITGTIASAEEIAQLEAQERAKEKVLDQAAASREQIVTIIDGRSGARQEVKIPGPVDTTISPGIDTALVEITRDGPIPRIGANGVRAAQAFAQPADAKPGPRIAIVITGLGVSNATAAEALNKLPAAVTFALAPSGSGLERLAGKARSLGAAAGANGAVGIAGQGSRAASAAGFAFAGAEYRAAALADEPVPGLCGRRQPDGKPPDRLGSGICADPAGDRQSRAHLCG
jgi:hypothetical protein